TAKAPDVGTFDGLGSPLIRSVEALQLGEDLLVRSKLAPGVSVSKGGNYALRTRQSRDELRDLWVYHVDLVPADGGVKAVEQARAALASISTGDVSGCAGRFDQTLHDSPRGASTAPYLRTAMKRLGEVSPGRRIEMRDGSSFDPESSIELTAAMSQPADAVGVLALPRGFVNRLTL